MEPNTLRHPREVTEETISSNPTPPLNYTERKELPERIRINSERLIVVLDYDLWDTTLRWSSSSHTAFVILRPFKLLVYQDSAIRNRLKDFERARTRLKQLTEEDYLREYEKDPEQDRPYIGRQNESAMTLSSLTGIINDLRCLIRFMDDYVAPAQIRFRDDPSQVRFSDLWYVFAPGSLIIVKDRNIPQKVWKVIQRTGGRRYLSRPDHINKSEFSTRFSPFVLDCYHLDYDGVRYVRTYGRFTISDFEGVQSVNSLPVYPFRVSVKEGTIDRNDMIARGQQFVQCTKVSHRYYSGRTHSRSPNGTKLSDGVLEVPDNASVFSERVDSEVIVDFERCLQEIPTWRPGSDVVDLSATDDNETGYGASHVDSDGVWDARSSEEFLEAETRKLREWEKLGSGPLDDEDLLLLPDRVFAFVLRTRKWGTYHRGVTKDTSMLTFFSAVCLQIGKSAEGQDRLRTVKSRPEPWNNLELPDGHKDIVQSLISSHFSKNKSSIHFDLVRDKGRFRNVYTY